VTRALPKRDLRIGPRSRKFIDAVNATGDPRRDNELVDQFLASEADPFRQHELKRIASSYHLRARGRRHI
jgi:hypothetical protein